MNKIKAILHNKVLYELSNKGYAYHKIIVDEFTSPRSYFSYLKQEGINEKVIRYEDATPFIYLKCLLEGYPYQVAMRHVVIDHGGYSSIVSKAHNV